MPAVETWDRVFSSNLDKAGAFLRVVGQHAVFPDQRRPRILNVGCGNGAQTLLLADAFPGCPVTGLDIAATNIRQAQELRVRSPHAERLEFRCGDYAQVSLGGYDLITADDSFHFVKQSPVAIFTKAAQALRPGGVLVFAIPYPCPANALLHALQRLLGVVRSRWTDALILRTSMLLHGLHRSRAFLAERVHYMYILPSCWAGRRLQRLLECRLGLTIVAREPYPHATSGQFKKVTWVCRKTAGGEL